MKTSHLSLVVLCAGLAGAPAWVGAQSTTNGTTPTGSSSVDAPAAMSARGESARDEYLSNNRWDAKSQSWVPMTTRRDMASMSRDEVRTETAQFLRTHRWDEKSSTWSLKTENARAQPQR